MTILIICAIIAATVLLIYDWKLGIYIIILAGFLQDPLRKSVLGQPVYLSVLVAAVFIICAGVALVRNNNWQLSHMTLNNELLFNTLFFYMLFILVSAVYTTYLYRSFLVALLGVSIYLMPFISAIYSSLLLDNYSKIMGFIFAYLACITILIITIGLSINGHEHNLLSEVGGGIDIYEHSISNYLKAHAGFSRSSELAAWHLATGACFSMIIGLQAKNHLLRLISFALTVACLLFGIFTGRRKMYMLFIVFCLLLLIFAMFDSQTKKRYLILFITIVACIFVYYLYSSFQRQLLYLSFANDYFSRTFTLLDDSFDRFQLSIGIFTYTLQSISLFGNGVGSTAQGIAHLVTVDALWNSETGLGRLGNEIGLVGLFLCLFLSAMLIVHIIKTNRIIQNYDPELSFLQKCFIAFLMANLFNYINAAQAYNDIFVLLLLGLVLGCVLGMPKVLYSRLKQSQL